MSHASKKSKSPRFYLALWASKFTLFALKVAKRKGGQLPGVVATKICPDFMSRLSTPDRLIFVTGTNGKTTTTNLIADMLESTGTQLVTNREGGNVANGIASTLIRNSGLGGKPKCETAVLELDERSARLVFPHVTPDVLVVTNLYRDTFTRNSHVGYVFDILSKAIPAESKLVLNADDLISCQLAPQNSNRAYYSMCELPQDTRDAQGIVKDLTACPECGGHLSYEYCHLGHIGRVSCDNCGLTNPSAQFEAIAVNYATKTITVRETADGTSYGYHFTASSVTDLYNLLGAITAARMAGMTPEQIAHALSNGVGIVASRYSELMAGGKRLVSIASKGENGMACSRGFANIRLEEGSKAVVLMLEDYYMAKDPTSTEFIGWLYETDFEFLADPSIKQIVVTGIRGEDMKLRLLLAGIDPSRIAMAKDGIAAADVVDWQNVDTVYYSHAIHNEYPAEESRAHLAQRIEQQN